MNVDYKFIYKDGFPTIKSNLIGNELDMLEVLSSDLNDLENINAFLNRMKMKKVWWFNAAKVEFNDNMATINPAFDWEGEEVKIKTCELKKIVDEWKLFIEQ